MSVARVYHMTLATRGYSPSQNAWSFEAHYTAALSGDIGDVRLDLADFGVEHFRRAIMRRYGLRIPEGKIRVGWEREESALAPSPDVHVEFREMTYRGKQAYARRLPAEVLRYGNKYDPEDDYDEAEDYEYEDEEYDSDECEENSDELEEYEDNEET
jgi:hypothetical protein